MRASAILACLAIAGSVALGPAAMAQSFDGITVIDLSDRAAHDAITGHSIGNGSYIVTYVSAAGTYAALENRYDRDCVAWAQPGSYTGDSITFGLPPSKQSLKLLSSRVCLPFTLSFSGPERVRVEATNKYDELGGPLSSVAKDVHYAGEHQVIARIPLIAFDWDMPVFPEYDVKGVRLGPLPPLRARLAGNAEFSLSPLQPIHPGTNKVFQVTTPNPSDPMNPTTVSGRVAAAEVLGWPWDVLYAAEYQGRLRKKSLTEAFEQAVVERYGQPSRTTAGPGGAVWLQWFFDLEGRQLPVGSAAPGNCLGTRENWIDESELKRINRDIGPWGCSLVMLLIHDGARGTVRTYSVQAASGYAMALNHFIGRLEEVRAMKEKIQEVQAFKPKL